MGFRIWRVKIGIWQKFADSKHNVSSSAKANIGRRMLSSEGKPFQMPINDYRKRQEERCLIEWICLCRETCFSLMQSLKTLNESVCETAHRNQRKPHISIWKFNPSITFPAQIQRPGRPPTGNSVDSTTRAPHRGHRPDTEEFSGPGRRSAPAVPKRSPLAFVSWQSTQELLLDVGAKSMPWSQRKLRLCLVWWAGKKKTARSQYLEREAAVTAHSRDKKNVAFYPPSPLSVFIIVLLAPRHHIYLMQPPSCSTHSLHLSLIILERGQ